MAVYFPACINRIFGPPKAERHLPSVPEAVVTVSERAGQPLWIPPDVTSACCATVWQSKGYREGNTLMANLIIERVWEWSDQGQLPVVIDAGSCTLGVTEEILPYLTDENLSRHQALTIVDSIGLRLVRSRRRRHGG